MNQAVIFAGGTGQRMSNKGLPKQFLEINNKPILIHTLEYFQWHEQIDQVILVCLADWKNYTFNLLNQYNITKVISIVDGGSTGQESIYYGLQEALKYGSIRDIVLLHDGVRPLITAELISSCISMVKEKGNAITVSPAKETIFIKGQSENQVGEILSRQDCVVAQAPQCFFLGDILEAHNKAIATNKLDFIDSATMMQYYGFSLFTVNGPLDNIKITTPIDLYTFKALLESRENMQIIGL